MYTVGDRFFGRLIFRTCLLTRTCYQHQDNQRLKGTFTFSHCPIFRRFSRSLKGVLKGVLSTLNEQAQSLDWVVSVICAKYIFTCSGMLTLLLQSLLVCCHVPTFAACSSAPPSSGMYVIDSPTCVTKQKSCNWTAFVLFVTNFNLFSVSVSVCNC